MKFSPLSLLGAACGAFCFSLATAAHAAPVPALASTFVPDFTTTEGYTATCQAMGEKLSTTSDDERVAFAICNDTTLVQQIVTWATQGMDRVEHEQLKEKQIVVEVGKEIDYALGRLAASREALEKVRLQNRKSLRLVPAQWQVDLNGDGKIDTWEKYFFAIPRRNDQAAHLAMPSDAADYYDREYNLDAAIKVDQSDVYWALSYHDFIESVLTVVRAYTVDEHLKITLTDAKKLQRGLALLDQGIATSEKLRRSVLAETGNDEEWIANPNQSNSVFPIALEAEDFATWGKVLTEMRALLDGKKLLPLSSSALLGQGVAECGDGYGLDLHALETHPIRSIDLASPQATSALGKRYCRKIDAHHPVTALVGMLNDRHAESSGLRVLRYLFWVN